MVQRRGRAEGERAGKAHRLFRIPKAVSSWRLYVKLLVSDMDTEKERADHATYPYGTSSGPRVGKTR